MSAKTADRVQELHDELLQSVEALVSGEDWLRTLDTMSRFHNYSFGNVMLILAQRPDATRCAGYRMWQSLGRQVRKGENGIAILAPMTYRREVKDDESGEVSEIRGIRGFRAAYVFDIGQTEGDELAEIRPEIVAGDSPEGLWEILASLVTAEGFSIELAIPDMVDAKGLTNHTTRVVTVHPDMPPAQRTKTLAHELAHVLMHGSENRNGLSRDRVEVEAESVAYMVCQGAGLVTDGYSFPYVARWAGGDVEVIAETGQRAVNTARGILEALTTSDPT